MPVAVVLCGSAGLGRAVVRRLAEEGWDVGVLARDEGRPAATVREVVDTRRRATSVSVDLADSAGVEAAVQEARGIQQRMLPANLHEAVPADVRERGVFGSRSMSWSPQAWAVTHRSAASVIGVAVTVAAAAAGVASRRAG